MKKFLLEILKFSLILVLGASILVLGTLFLEKEFTSFEIPANKTVLVMGDSKVECAVNDEILDPVYNFSQSGTAYFYTYLKARKMVNDNPQIDTLVVGYSYADLSQARDEWFKGEKYIKGKFREHFFLMNFNDLYAIFISNPLDVISSLFPIRLITPSSDQNLERWGGYLYLERDKLHEAMIRNDENQADLILGYSQYQEEYLLKIYELAMDHDLNFILLTTPIHPLLEERLDGYKDHYAEFVEEKLPNALVINHSSLTIPEDGYGDLGHLNHQGARIYSKYLSDQLIFEP